MCLYVTKSHALKPIAVMSGWKFLRLREGNSGKLRFTTPYQDNTVPFGDGHFEARNFLAPVHHFTSDYIIMGGFIHSTTTKPMSMDVEHYGKLSALLNKPFQASNDVAFNCLMLNVYALGDCSDVVSRGIYLPAFDLRTYTDGEIQLLKQRYPLSFTRHTKTVLSKLDRLPTL